MNVTAFVVHRAPLTVGSKKVGGSASARLLPQYQREPAEPLESLPPVYRLFPV